MLFLGYTFEEEFVYITHIHMMYIPTYVCVRRNIENSAKVTQYLNAEILKSEKTLENYARESESARSVR